ncbi:hypothetical protein B0H11DRAFT_2193117 [Mycena galericulata]|nr:hypothetical protein B0H11DRAFT_2193117 [Mycena galericulata]
MVNLNSDHRARAVPVRPKVRVRDRHGGVDSGGGVGVDGGADSSVFLDAIRTTIVIYDMSVRGGCDPRRGLGLGRDEARVRTKGNAHALLGARSGVEVLLSDSGQDDGFESPWHSATQRWQHAGQIGFSPPDRLDLDLPWVRHRDAGDYYIATSADSAQLGNMRRRGLDPSGKNTAQRRILVFRRVGFASSHSRSTAWIRIAHGTVEIKVEMLVLVLVLVFKLLQKLLLFTLLLSLSLRSDGSSNAGEYLGWESKAHSTSWTGTSLIAHGTAEVLMNKPKSSTAQRVGQIGFAVGTTRRPDTIAWTESVSAAPLGLSTEQQRSWWDFGVVIVQVVAVTVVDVVIRDSDEREEKQRSAAMAACRSDRIWIYEEEESTAYSAHGTAWPWTGARAQILVLILDARCAMERRKQ